MLGENIQFLRKQKGLTQEELAIRLHVVRQTVSKWEKGLSVPDAETMQKIAEELDVPMEQLFGAEIKVEENRNEVAEQLARINEQLAIKNRRARRIWKIIGAGFFASIVLTIVAIAVLGVVRRDQEKSFQDYLEGVVTEIEDDYFIIEVTSVDDVENQGQLIGQCFKVYYQQVGDEMYELVVGDIVRLGYLDVDIYGEYAEFLTEACIVEITRGIE